MGLWGPALSGWLFGLSVSPTDALSITDTHADIVSGSTNPIMGGLLGLGLVGGFPNATSGHNSFRSIRLGRGLTADGSGVAGDNVTRLSLNSSSNLFPEGRVGDSIKYQATAAFSNEAPVAVSPSGDHASLFIDWKRAVEGGGAAIRASVAPAFPLTGLFADPNVRRSGTTFGCDGCVDVTSTAPEPARLLLFGAALVALGAVVRRRIRGLEKAV